MFVLEALQNVSRHSDQGQHADMSLVVYSKTDNGYTVTNRKCSAISALVI